MASQNQHLFLLMLLMHVGGHFITALFLCWKWDRSLRHRIFPVCRYSGTTVFCWVRPWLRRYAGRLSVLASRFLRTPPHGSAYSQRSLRQVMSLYTMWPPSSFGTFTRVLKDSFLLRDIQVKTPVPGLNISMFAPKIVFLAAAPKRAVSKDGNQ